MDLNFWLEDSKGRPVDLTLKKALKLKPWATAGPRRSASRSRELLLGDAAESLASGFRWLEAGSRPLAAGTDLPA